MDLTTLAGMTRPTACAACAPRRAAPWPTHRGRAGAGGYADDRRGLRVSHHGRRGGCKALEGSGIPVASVATGFPAGLMPLDLRLAEIRYAVDQGAQEIDIVITRAHVLGGDWAALYDEIAAMKDACGPAHMKAILATGDLVTLSNVYAASRVAMQAGADFIKTSTGKEGVNATLPVGLTMCRAIRDHRAPPAMSWGSNRRAA